MKNYMGTGLRVVGNRKSKLLGIVGNVLEQIHRKNVSPIKYLGKRWKIKNANDIKNINTKKLTGLISDLKEYLVKLS